MENIHIFYSHFLVISTVALALMAGYSAKKKHSPISTAFSLLLLSFAIYDYGYARELTSTTLSAMDFWEKFETVGNAGIASLWILITLRYTRPQHKIPLPFTLLLIALPALNLFIRFSPNYLHYLYTSISVGTDFGVPALKLEYGPFIYVHIAYFIFTVVFCCILYYQRYVKATGNMKMQALILMGASVFPFCAFMLLISDYSPYNLDLIPLAISISAAFFVAALFRYHLLSLIPLAREHFFNWSDQGVLILDSHFSLMDFNHAATRIFPHTLSEQLIGSELKQVMVSFTDFTDQVLNGEPYQFQMPCSTPNSNIAFHHYKSHLKPLYDGPERAGYVIIIEDITQQVLNMRHLEELASTDSLTGLLNRRAFTKSCLHEIQRSVRYNHPFSLVLLDLDYFKAINDTHGHLAGDAALIQVAAVCTATLRTTDQAGRYGGEEFILMLPETSLEEAVHLSERIRSRIENLNLNYSGVPLVITTSIGVSELMHSGLMNENNPLVAEKIFDRLITTADDALFIAKKRGRNQIVSTLPLDHM